jgi:hypothetical protein
METRQTATRTGQVARRFIVIACTVAALSGGGPALEANAAPGIAYILPAISDANQNLDLTAGEFISAYRRGSIHRVFPTELYPVTLGTIQNGRSKSYKTAWKLLNDLRFIK